MSRAKYTRNLKITRLCILQLNFQLCVSQSRSVSLSEVCGHFQDHIQNNWVWQAFDLISPGPCTWLMYTGALHCTWITVCSFGACKEHRYLLFCMVKAGGRSQLRAVAAALQLLSKSCQWSLRRAPGLPILLLLFPPLQDFEHKYPESHVACAELGAQSCALTSASFTRWLMPRMALGGEGGGKCYPKPKHEHTPHGLDW